MNLDELMTQARPPVSPRTPELTAALSELASATEFAASPRRSRKLSAAAAAALALVAVGAGGAATANGHLPGWFPWTTESGSSCGLQASVELRRDGDGVLITDRWSEPDQRRTLATARDYLGSFDLESIDRKQAAERWFTYMLETSVGQPERAELESRFHGETLEVHSILYAVDARLDDYLTRRGYDADSIMTTVASQCAK